MMCAQWRARDDPTLSQLNLNDQVEENKLPSSFITWRGFITNTVVLWSRQKVILTVTSDVIMANAKDIDVLDISG